MTRKIDTDIAIQTTSKEDLVLQAIGRNFFCDGDEGPGVWVWANCLDQNHVPGFKDLDPTSYGGVVTSLVKKGLMLADTFHSDPDEHTHCLTEIGWAAMLRAEERYRDKKTAEAHARLTSKK